LIGSTAGCVTIVKKKPAPTAEEMPPIINSFTTTPADISAGQRTTLSWDVSGATEINIQPGISTVGPSGTLLLTPAASITYTLTATNQSGSTAASATVTVTPAVTGEPDLVITDIWLTGSVVNYKIANRGDADAKPSQSYFYINNLKQSSDWVDALAAGEEITTSFGNFNWNLSGVAGAPAPQLAQFNVKACADAGNDIEESVEDNNCLAKIWGQTFTYDFADNAHMAEWRSGAGELKWPIVGGNSGSASAANEMLMMCPQKVSNGWIQGRFADYYTLQLGSKISSRDIEIPQSARFTARVGLTGDTATDSVRVAFGYLDATGSVVLFPKMDISSGEASRVYEVDLSDMAGKKTEFILWVEAKDGPVEGCVKWVEPKIVQE
ncbi:CARDB domain-containing protein, partial [Chloroflexota bacterium]